MNINPDDCMRICLIVVILLVIALTVPCLAQDSEDGCDADYAQDGTISVECQGLDAPEPKPIGQEATLYVSDFNKAVRYIP